MLNMHNISFAFTKPKPFRTHALRDFSLSVKNQENLRGDWANPFWKSTFS